MNSRSARDIVDAERCDVNSSMEIDRVVRQLLFLRYVDDGWCVGGVVQLEVDLAELCRCWPVRSCRSSSGQHDVRQFAALDDAADAPVRLIAA